MVVPMRLGATILGSSVGGCFYLFGQGLWAWSGCLFVPGLVEGAVLEHGVQDVDAAAVRQMRAALWRLFSARFLS